MKFCTKCGIEKPVTHFNVKYKATGKLHSYCKACQAQYSIRYYQKNTDKVKQSAKVWVKQNRKDNQQHMANYLLTKCCVDCGTNDMRVLEFDHVDPTTKYKDIANMMRDCTWTTILEEIEKCDICCANCHRIRTYSNGKSYRDIFVSMQITP